MQRPGEDPSESLKGDRKDRHKGCSQQDILSLKKPSQVPANPPDRLAVSGHFIAAGCLRVPGKGLARACLWQLPAGLSHGTF